MSIDTLEYVKTLEGAGVERKVAEAHVKAMNVHVVPEIATSADIDRLEKATHADIDRLESGTRAEIARLEQKIETMVQRVEATVWKGAIATMGGVLASGSLLIRFLR